MCLNRVYPIDIPVSIVYPPVHALPIIDGKRQLVTKSVMVQEMYFESLHHILDSFRNYLGEDENKEILIYSIQKSTVGGYYVRCHSLNWTPEHHIGLIKYHIIKHKLGNT
jgi:hypothetical protein